MSEKPCHCLECQRKRRGGGVSKPSKSGQSLTKKKVLTTADVALSCRKHDHCSKDRCDKECGKDKCDEKCDKDCRRPVYIEVVPYQPDQCCPSSCGKNNCDKCDKDRCDKCDKDKCDKDKCDKDKCDKEKCFSPPLYFSGSPAGLSGTAQQLIFMGLGQQNTDEFLVAYLAGCTAQYNTIRAAVKVITLVNATASLRFTLMRRLANAGLNDEFLLTGLSVDVPVVFSGHATPTVSACCGPFCVYAGDLVLVRIQLLQISVQSTVTFTGTAVVSMN